MNLDDVYAAVDAYLKDLPESMEEQLYDAFRYIDGKAFARGYNRCAADFKLGVTIEPEKLR